RPFCWQLPDASRAGKSLVVKLIHMRIIKAAQILFLWLVPIGLVLVGGAAVTTALPYGAGTYGTCTYGTCSISISTSGTVNLPVTPTTTGINTTAKDDVTVETGSSTGYTL